MLVVGHKHAMEVCEEQLSNTVPSSPIRQDRNCCQLHHGGVRVGGVAEALRAKGWLPYWMTTVSDAGPAEHDGERSVNFAGLGG